MTEHGTFYPHLRELLDERFTALSDDEIDAVFADALGEGVSPAEYEEFFGGLGQAISRLARQAGPALGPVLRGAGQGAAAGSLLGPVGTIGGAIAGGLGSALGTHARGPARDIGRAVSGVVGTAGMLGGGVPGALGGVLGRRGGPATSALQAVLGRPETARALNAMFTGRNPAIPVGRAGAPVPANAFAGLLSALAREAEAEAEAQAGWADSVPVPAYLLDAEGQLVVDPTDQQQRAARLLQLLAGERDDLADADDALPSDDEPTDAELSDEDLTEEDLWADLDEDDVEILGV